MGKKSVFEFNATLIANEFIDKYMPDANGDYVKVYLYFLRNSQEDVPKSKAAEDLHLTEGDVGRAFKFWQEKGLLGEEDTLLSDSASADLASVESALADSAVAESKLFKDLISQDELRNRYRSTEGKTIVDKLQTDREFAQLLFIVQKYLSKILTERDQEVIAFLYDGLKLPADVIDYLVEYCVSSKGHCSIRYIETVGIDWASLGIKTVGDARKHTEGLEEVSKGRSKRSKARISSISRGITRDTKLDDIVQQWINNRV